MPPPMVALSWEKSSLRNSGCCIKALNSVLTPKIKCGGVRLSVLTNSLISRGLGTSLDANPRYKIKTQQMVNENT